MNNTSTLDNILGYVPDPPPALVDNWETLFIWLAMGAILFAIIALFYGFKRGIQGKHVNKGMLPFVKWPLLFASAGFNVFFTYYVFLPAGVQVAAFSAVVMGGVNLAEAYLVRLIIATWRHDMKTVFRLALVFTIPVFVYSLTAAGSSFSTMMNKNKDSLAASQLELQAAQDRIKQADAQVNEAKIGAENGNLLNALYRTEVRNSKGVSIPFSTVKESCFSGGYYARHYPELCNQYQNLATGVHTAATVASASTNALATSAAEKQNMAEILKERPPQITPVLFGFALSISAVGFIVSLALESAIVGVGFFEELFIKPTPLPGLVKFANKALDWNADSITQRGLQVDVSPSPGTVNFSGSDVGVTPFSTFGWDSKNPTKSVPSTVNTGNSENTAPETGKSVLSTVNGENDKGTVQESDKSVLSTVQDIPNNVAGKVYAIVKKLVESKEIKPTVRPVTDAVANVIREQGDTIGITYKETTKPQRQRLAENILERLEQEKVTKRNTEGGVGKPKYVLA